MKDFNKIVKILCKKSGKLFFRDEIFELIDPERKSQYNTQVNKIIYRLKAQGIIISIKAGVYVVPDEEDLKINKVDLLEKYYMRLLKKIIIKEVGNSYYISGTKSLEIHMKNYEVPEKIFVVNRSVNKRVKIGEKEIVFKTISGKNSTGLQKKKVNLYAQFSKLTMKKELEGIELRISCLELALLESALVSDTMNGFDIGLLSKTLKKYKSVLDTKIFYTVAQYKYILSFNRLKELAKPLDTKLYGVFLDIIKKNGNLFIGEGVRGI